MKFIELINGKKTRRKLPSGRRKVVFYRDGSKCRYCGKKVEYHKFHLDHAHPVKPRDGRYGGNDYVFNIVTACANCNLKRSNNENIQPNDIALWRQLYQFWLILKYEDWPKLEDFT
jgi:5-methylcytosine-specific restriction endonuclease McrA